jgi:predicted aspartyl protease
MQIARGEEYFELYAGIVLLDEQDFNIPVVAAIELQENLLGLQWLQILRLVIDFPARVLILG